MKPIVHSTFVVERTYPSSPAQVFAAFGVAEQKQKWFNPPDGTTMIERSFDFRVGGREVSEGRFASGMTSRFVGCYTDIVPDQLIAYTYEMWINGERLSVSVATIEIIPQGGGVKLVVSESGAYWGSASDAASREHGTNWLIDKLGATLPPA